MARDRAVHPDCPNASNPFHICADYCAHGSVRSANPTVNPMLAPNGVGNKETGDKAGGGKRSVDPLCINSSNPFHQCADYCARKNHDGKSPSNGVVKLDGAKEKVGVADKISVNQEKAVIASKRNVNPSCPNASNPFHQCQEYCSPRNADQYKHSNSGSSRGGIKNAIERKDVNPECVNASNPFHKCSEYCSRARRINGVA